MVNIDSSKVKLLELNGCLLNDMLLAGIVERGEQRTVSMFRTYRITITSTI
jgi:hypothetical protein